jgi:hypothetical protein
MTVPMSTSALGTFCSAPVGQVRTQSMHSTHLLGFMMGVPTFAHPSKNPAGFKAMGWQTSMQRLQRVQNWRKAFSSTAPGGLAKSLAWVMRIEKNTPLKAAVSAAQRKKFLRDKFIP